MLPAVHRLRGILREASPNIVHCFLYWGYLIGVPAARSVRVPVVVSSRRSLTAAAGRIGCSFCGNGPAIVSPVQWSATRPR